MKNNILFGIGLLVSSFFVVFFVFAYNAGTDFILCSSTFNGVSCTLNWTVTGSSSQTAYQIQIDDNSNFNSPESDTGVVNSINNFYVVNTAGLSFGVNYYWRIKIQDNYGSWITEWVEGDSAFQLSAACAGSVTAASLTVSSHGPATYCGTALHNFSWVFTSASSNDQSRFQFQVDDDSGFGSPEVDRDFTGLSNPSPTTNNQIVYVASAPTADKLTYNNTYYWRVKVYDNSGNDSGWVSGSAFSTATHSYPDVDFSWQPNSPSVGDNVQFTDNATCSVGCSGWSWGFSDGTPSTSSIQNPIIQFSSDGLKSTTLQVTDTSAYSCSVSKNVDIGTQIPDWREILPQ